MRRFERLIRSLSAGLECVGMAALAAMVVVAILDAVGAKVFKWPVPGSTEITGLLQVLAISSGLAFSKIDGRQIYVGLILDTAKRRVKKGLEALRAILSLGFWAVASWMGFKYGLTLAARGTGTLALRVPLYPFAIWVALCCCLVLCLLLIIDIVRLFAKRDAAGGDA